jgi:hypothetical protein
VVRVRSGIGSGIVGSARYRLIEVRGLAFAFRGYASLTSSAARELTEVPVLSSYLG